MELNLFPLYPGSDNGEAVHDDDDFKLRENLATFTPVFTWIYSNINFYSRFI